MAKNYAEKRNSLIFFFAFTRVSIGSLEADLFVVLFECGHILTCLTELALFHTLTDVPVNKGTLGVHEIELVIKTSPGFGNGGGVAQHADSTLDLGQITAWDDGWWLVIDTDLDNYI